MNTYLYMRCIIQLDLDSYQELVKLKQSITERKAVNAELTVQRDSLRDSLEMDRNRLEQLDINIAEAVVSKKRVSLRVEKKENVNLFG